MSLKYRILIMFVIAVFSRSSAQRCSRSYVDGKWISAGDCGGADMMSDIMGDLKRRSEEEKKGTVFQRRKYGNVDFYRGWDDYKNGFGNRDGDFWLGLEELHVMTKDGDMELEINMITRNESHIVAKYSSFRVGPGPDKYRLHVSGHYGNTTGRDALAFNNNLQFSTHDADHDGRPTNCASDYEGGWWFGCDGCIGCAANNLNGNFSGTGRKGIWWWSVGPNSVILRSAEMKMRSRARN